MNQSDPEVVNAEALVYKWTEQQEKAANESPDQARARISFNVARTMMYVRASFTDPNYVSYIQSFLYADDLDYAVLFSLRSPARLYSQLRF